MKVQVTTMNETIELEVNGVKRKVEAEAETSLLEVLRESKR